jgi:hypothetical protein
MAEAVKFAKKPHFTYPETDPEDLQCPFTESPLDAHRGAAKRRPKGPKARRATEGRRQAKSLPAAERVRIIPGPVLLSFC